MYRNLCGQFSNSSGGIRYLLLYGDISNSDSPRRRRRRRRKIGFLKKAPG